MLPYCFTIFYFQSPLFSRPRASQASSTTTSVNAGSPAVPVGPLSNPGSDASGASNAGPPAVGSVSNPGSAASESSNAGPPAADVGSDISSATSGGSNVAISVIVPLWIADIILQNWNPWHRQAPINLIDEKAYFYLAHRFCSYLLNSVFSFDLKFANFFSLLVFCRFDRSFFLYLNLATFFSLT